MVEVVSIHALQACSYGEAWAENEYSMNFAPMHDRTKP